VQCSADSHTVKHSVSSAAVCRMMQWEWLIYKVGPYAALKLSCAVGSVAVVTWQRRCSAVQYTQCQFSCCVPYDAMGMADL
jgi:hypothetical protein